MGMEIDGHEDGSPIIAMDFADRVTGRPGYLHGGAIGGLLEMAGFAALHAELDRQGLDVRIKPVNINIEFLRGGIEQRTFAKGTVADQGGGSPMCGSKRGKATHRARWRHAG
jgi:uncharacterized protein (TIGR00369 family)